MASLFAAIELILTNGLIIMKSTFYCHTCMVNGQFSFYSKALNIAFDLINEFQCEYHDNSIFRIQSVGLFDITHMCANLSSYNLLRGSKTTFAFASVNHLSYNQKSNFQSNQLKLRCILCEMRMKYFEKKKSNFVATSEQSVRVVL